MVGTIEKPSARRGAWSWFHGIPTYGVKVIEFQSFYELENMPHLTTFGLFNEFWTKHQLGDA